MTILRFKLILENSVEQKVYRIPENLREENSSQFPIKKVAIWSTFSEHPRGDPRKDPWEKPEARESQVLKRPEP